MRGLRATALATAALIAATLALAVTPRAARAKDALTIGISQFPSNFNPLINAMTAKSYIIDMARRPITVYDANWKLICMLCTELPSLAKGTAKYETTADGKPGIAVTFTLRPEFVWGDGTPITTKDVLFTWEVGRNPKSGAGNFELFSRITSIDVKDAKTFTLHVNKRTCDYDAINDFELLPEHLERKNFTDPAAYVNRSAYETDTTNPGLWFGPYHVTQVVSGSHVVLEQNPLWKGKKPAFKQIIVRTIENTGAMTANLLSGSIDLVAGEVGLTLDQALAFEKRHGKRFNVLYKPGLIYEHIDLNLDNPILADRRVRQALLLAIDRKTITEKLFEGHQPVADGSIHPLDSVYDPDIPKYPYDPAKAKALLDAAGWTEIRGGIRYNAKGERLQFEFMTTAGNKSRELVQQALQSQWRQVGVDARIRNEPARVYFGETVTKRKFTAFAMFAWTSSPENIPRTTLHSSMIPTAANNWSGQNYTGYRSPKMDKLIDDVEVQCEPKRNRQLWYDIQTLYATDLPALPLYFRADAYILPRWLKGVTPTGHQYPTTLWVEDWTVGQ
jgi:peptide/nickel transport system substrate-binding protein